MKSTYLAIFLALLQISNLLSSTGNCNKSRTDQRQRTNLAAITGVT